MNINPNLDPNSGLFPNSLEKLRAEVTSIDRTGSGEAGTAIPQNLMKSLIAIKERVADFSNTFNLGIYGETSISVHDVSFKILTFPGFQGNELYVSLADVGGELGKGGYKTVTLAVKLSELNKDLQLMALAIEKPPENSEETTINQSEEMINEHNVTDYLKNSLGLDGVFSSSSISQFTVDGETRNALISPLCLGSYKDLIDGKISPLPLEKKFQNAEKLFQTLNAVHDAKFTHNDIKDDNIFLDKDSNAKLADWGTVKNYDNTESSENVLKQFNIECGSDKKRLAYAIYDTFTDAEKMANRGKLSEFYARNGVSFDPGNKHKTFEVK